MSESESARSDATAAAKAPVASYVDVLRSLKGKVITMVNPESLEDAPMGHQLTTGFYRAKVLHVGTDYFSVATEYQHRGKEGAKEPVKQYIPLVRLKRISLMKSEVVVHI